MSPRIPTTPTPRTENPVSATPTYDRMKHVLLHTDVTARERALLLDMAVSIDSDPSRREHSLLYVEGDDRLALALGERPGTTRAETAVSGTIIDLLHKRLIAHWCHVYELVVLTPPPSPESTIEPRRCAMHPVDGAAP